MDKILKKAREFETLPIITPPDTLFGESELSNRNFFGVALERHAIIINKYFSFLETV